MPSLIRVLRRSRRARASSSDRMVSSRPNSFISARSFALLIFMRSGLAFSAGCASSTAATSSGRSSPPRSSSMSERSASSRSSPALPPLASALGLRPRLAAGLSAAALAGRPGFFFAGASSSNSSLRASGLAFLAVLLAVVLAAAFLAGAAVAAALVGVLVVTAGAFLGAATGFALAGAAFLAAVLVAAADGLAFFVGMDTSKKRRWDRQNTQQPPEDPTWGRTGGFGRARTRHGPVRAGRQAVGRSFGVQSLRGSARPGRAGWPGWVAM